MSKGVKVVLIIIGVLVLLCGLSVGGVVLWFNANKDTLKADGDKARTDGLEFGKANEADACITEALRRLDADRGIVAQALTQVFLQNCLIVAPRPPGFCDAVPAKGEVMDTATWAVAQCEKRGHSNDQECGRMMQVVQKSCVAK